MKKLLLKLNKKLVKENLRLRKLNKEYKHLDLFKFHFINNKGLWDEYEQYRNEVNEKNKIL